MVFCVDALAYEIEIHPFGNFHLFVFIKAEFPRGHAHICRLPYR